MGGRGRGRGRGGVRADVEVWGGGDAGECHGWFLLGEGVEDRAFWGGRPWKASHVFKSIGTLA